MQKSRRTPVLLSLLSLLASLMILIPSGVANAAESIPTLQWPSVTIGATDGSPVTSPNGDITVPCQPGSSGSDLVTYGATGQLVRQIDRTTVVDGVPNCITAPTADKNGHVYGRPYGKVGSTWKFGANLLAYNGNTLKWKYPLACSSGVPSYEVGANGNIYSTARMSDGSVHLIGLSPEVAVGQTEPTKVLDISIPTNCTTILRTYKDGVVVHAQSGGHALYYSYGGKFLGQATIGSLWDEKIDAEGRLFVASVMSSGGVQGYGVSRYDPNKGDVRWTAAASTTGAAVNDITLSPLPGGAVAALITEQKMLSGGLPASPTVWVKTLVVINAAGVKVYSEQLENTYAGGTFGNGYLASESGGKVVVTRELAVNTGLSNPTTVPGVAVRVFDPSSNTWTYSQGIIGDLTKSGGPSGYKLESMDLIASQPVNNTLYVRAECTNNCDGSKKLFAVAVTGMGTSYPQGDILVANTPAQPAPGAYVALGDSYSSGEGVEPFEDGSDTSADKCHRSELAYAKLVSRNPKVKADLTTGEFAACSGAKTEHVQLTPTPNDPPTYNTEPLQVTNLNVNTKVVTITIGGNNIGFVDFGTACANPTSTCRIGSSAHTTAVGKINNELPSELEDTYRKILDEAPAAQVYVLDYPQVAPIKTTGDPQDPRCSYLYDSGYDSTGTIPMYWADAQAARDVVTKLDDKIADVVDTVRGINTDYSQRLHYVSVNENGSPFDGHTVCADPESSYFHNLDQWAGHPAYTLHPNEYGQQAYADIAVAAMLTP
ncbi:MAG: SGNH/GDSL hydrolase family protein [Candidatus Saccharibacteria bacterium]|nr:MAG: SGNH/GDSL hydrolase family protein [Candidatus Saccharibacteria bacterium]